MSKTIDDILSPKPEARLRIYAWTPNDPPAAYAGLIKVGQTTQSDVNERIRQSQGQMQQAYTLHVDVFAEMQGGQTFRDGHVRQRLTDKGFENVVIGASREWMRCTADDVKTAITELQHGVELSGTHHETFGLRREQADAVNQTWQYYRDFWKNEKGKVPRFLWNAKMRFGKTFTAYQLAKKMGAKRVLVVTFKPAVEDAWKADLESHIDFNGWQYLSDNSGGDPTKINAKEPVVYFGSFQNLLGREGGKIKPKNKWIHKEKWDLVIFDEYHFGAWRESAKELFEGEEDQIARREHQIRDEEAATTKAAKEAIWTRLADARQALDEVSHYLPIQTRAYLYLSGTPFRALNTGEFIEDQIYNWTYTDEQRAKREFAAKNPGKWNPYGALPQMALLTYRMPPELLDVASQGEFDEFDLNEFFDATGDKESAGFKHKTEVQKWLNIIRGQDLVKEVEYLKSGGTSPFPYADVTLLQYLQHSFWFLPNVAACHAMANLLKEKHNVFWHDYEIICAAGTEAGIGLKALDPVRRAIGSGSVTKTITLSCGKLTTGVTVKQWSSILMLRNLQSPETYFQAAFRVQSPWSIRNPNGDNLDEEEIQKPSCCVFDFAPTRALRQLSEYGIGLQPEESNPENAVKDLVSFLPVLAYQGGVMTPVDAGSILDIAMSGTSATLLARKWESPLLVNVDNETLNKVLKSPEALAALENIEDWRKLGDNVIETIINKSEKIKALKNKAQEKGLTAKQKKELTKEETEYKSLRKKVQEKLIKFATRIPAFMYLTDYRENALKDVITKIEPTLFKTVTGLTIKDFNLLAYGLKVFNTEQMNAAVFAFRRYEDASLRYTGIESHEGLSQIGGWDTVVARE